MCPAGEGLFSISLSLKRIQAKGANRSHASHFPEIEDTLFYARVNDYVNPRLESLYSTHMSVRPGLDSLDQRVDQRPLRTLSGGEGGVLVQGG